MICMNDTWINKPANCTTNPCFDAPYTLANSATVLPSSNASTGISFNVTCLTGYTGGGTGSMICMNDTWINKPANCTANPCYDAPYSLANSATLLPSSNASTGTSFNVTCVIGYTGGGTGSMVCMNDTWINKPANCTANPCYDAPYSLENTANVRPSSNASTGISFNVTCMIGFTGGGTGSMICMNDTWINRPANCTANPCYDAPYNIANSDSVWPTSNSSTGSTFNVTCLIGYSGGGNGSMVCVNNSWSNKPTCQPNTCKDAPYTIANSDSVSPTTNMTTGSIFNVTCAPGFSDGGTGSMICDDNNLWQNPPNCTGKVF